MVNGADKNFRRLVLCVSSYRTRFSEWPTEARAHPLVLENLAHLLGTAQFEELQERLPISGDSEIYLLEVHGKAGAVSYEEIDLEDHVTEGGVDEAVEWLGVDEWPGSGV